MHQELYDKTYDLENRYWWYIGRRYIFNKILEYFFPGGEDKKIADIGCGTGGVMKMLAKHGEVRGLDIEPRALEFCRNKGFNNVALMKGFYETGLSSESVDLVAMFDVLEHFEDDVKALREVNRVLSKDGYALISVPAFQFLWSELDQVAHHFRRYTKKGLESKLQRADFEIVKSSYLFFFVFPLILTYRLLGKLKKEDPNPKFNYVEFPKPITWILVFFSKLEDYLLKFIRFPVGSTIVVLAKKVR